MRSVKAALPGRISGQFVLAVLDADNAVPELNEANNLVAFGPVR